MIGLLDAAKSLNKVFSTSGLTLKNYEEAKKAYEKAYDIDDNEIGLAIFDDELTPKQLRIIEGELKILILDDRTSQKW